MSVECGTFLVPEADPDALLEQAQAAALDRKSVV